VQVPQNSNLEQEPEAQSPETILRTIRWKRSAQILLDAFLIALSFFGAFLIRFDCRLVGHSQGLSYLNQIECFLPAVVALRLLANWYFGLYRRLWRYTGLTEIMELVLSVASVSALLFICRAAGLLIAGGRHLSYGIIAIDAGLCLLLLVAPRVLRRLQTEHVQRKHWRQPFLRRAILVGAGDAGMMVLKELRRRHDLKIELVGVLDDDPSKQNSRFGHLSVLGTIDDLPRLAESLFIDQVIIAIPSAPPSKIRRIIDLCQKAEVETRILPGLFELINGKVSVNQLRDVSLEDLLGREPVKLDTDSISHYLKDRCILVTGAGGSIGSELCRQIIRFGPRTLLLVGKGENSIYAIQQELLQRAAPVTIIPIIADVRDEQRMHHVFAKYRPHVVFHAAAHKHVPLMEDNVSEAVRNNVFGTRNVAELSKDFEAETFVLVSSDKAVNPTSVMGATKRMAELVIQDLAVQTDHTKYVAVRFGNVLASRGSVVPLWRQQIAAGGPVTVTHPEATRYFMLIPEAVQLILQAGGLGKGGEIFVLDMGKPVKILELATDLIKSSGLVPGEDIEIKFVGLRPGEKLYEELLTAAEGLTQTSYEKIFVGHPQLLAEDVLQESLNELRRGADQEDDRRMREALHLMAGGTVLASVQSH
jgi:FlaA1/EpsC-like NDP-sugar epimerase